MINVSLTQEGDKIILNEEMKISLREDIKRNGGKLIDPEFRGLEKYLTLNPLDEGAKSRTSKKK